MILSIPVVSVFESDKDLTTGEVPLDVMTFKNNYVNFIQSMSVDFNNQVVNQSMNHLNLLSHFKMMMKEDNDFNEISGE